MHKFTFILIQIIALLSFNTVVAETTKIKVETPGQLRQLAFDIDGAPESITIEGKLNAEDLKCIAEGNGLWSTVKTLDVSKVTFEYGGTYYNSKYIGKEYGYTAYFYLSDLNTVEGNNVYNNCFDGVFINLDQLESVILPDWLPEIGWFAFYDCTNLKSVKTGKNVSKICMYAFYRTKLENLEIGKNVSFIGDYAFSGTYIKSFESNRIDSIGYSAFSSSDLENIDLSSCKHIGGYAFSGTRLTGVLLADGLTTIPSCCFSSTSYLTDIFIPSSVKSVASDAFKDSKWLKNHPGENGVVYINSIAYKPVPKNIGSTLKFKEGTTLINDDFLYFTESDIPVTTFNVELPKSIKEIGSNAFSGSKKIKKISWEDTNLEVINEGAFKSCTNFGFSALPSSLKSIGKSAFIGCNNIFAVNFGPNLESVGSNAFENCTGIQSVELHTPELDASKPFNTNNSITKAIIGAEVKVVPANFLYGCNNLTDIYFEDRADGQELKLMDNSITGNVYNIRTAHNIPSGLTHIGAFCFIHTDVTGIDLSNVEYIGKCAFHESRGLPSTLTLPKKLKQIYVGAFCCDIETVIVESENLEVAESAFADYPYHATFFYQYNSNYSLKRAVIGKNVTNLPGDYVGFNGWGSLIGGCVELESVDFEERDKDNPTPLELGAYTVGYATIGQYDFVSKVENWKLPNGTVKCAVNAFDSSIRHLELPETFTEFTGSFWGSYTYVYNSMDTIICYAVEPPLNFRSFLQNCARSRSTEISGRDNNLLIYVPAESVEEYKKIANIYSYDKCEVRPLTDLGGVDEILSDENETIAAIYNIQGILMDSNDIESLTPGLYIIKYESGKSKKIII